MQVTTWGEIDSSWIGRSVRVRWEDGGMPLAEGLPSGMPHEWNGKVMFDGEGFYLSTAPLDYIEPPAHALVQQEEA